jgi:alpha-N-arabinofuranosidase
MTRSHGWWIPASRAGVPSDAIEQGDLSEYDTTRLPVWMSGNVFLKGAKPSKQEAEPFLKPDFDPALNLLLKPDGLYLEITADKAWATERTRKLATTELLGKEVIPDQVFENPDGTPLRIDTDYFGKQRNEKNPFPGPFEIPAGGKLTRKVWETKEISQ